MKRSLFIAAAMIIVSLPVQLSSEEDIVPLGVVVDAYIDFGFNVYSEISRDNDQSNIFISPLSLGFAASILYNGAAGETMEEFKNTLGLENISLSSFNAANKALLTEYGMYDARSDNIDLEIYNSLWMSKRWEFKEDFKNNVIDYYGAETYLGLDKSRIIEWIKDKTRGKIDTIEFELQPLSAAIIINTIYYKNEWAHKFNPHGTYKASFFLCDNTVKDIDMMPQKRFYNYYENDTIQAIETSMAGQVFSALIILPKEGMCIDEIIIDAASLDSIDNMKQYLPGQLHLPKFRAYYESGMAKTLSNMGIATAFNPHQANFEKMAYFKKQKNFYIQNLIQKTFLEVNEDGLEASAVTLFHVVGRGLPPEDEFEMVVDRPFYIIIRDNRYGLILFMGAIYDPIMIN